MHVHRCVYLFINFDIALTLKIIYMGFLLSFFCQEETLKAGAYVCWCVQSLVTLEQGGSINLTSLEAQLETLLESVVTFNPPGKSSSRPSSSTSSTTRNKFFALFSRTTSSFFLCRGGFGAEAHGLLQSLQWHAGFAQRSGRFNGWSACCSCHYLAGQKGEGLSDSASSHSLLPLPCISATHDTYHGGMHHSILQPWWETCYPTFFI